MVVLVNQKADLGSLPQGRVHLDGIDWAKLVQQLLGDIEPQACPVRVIIVVICEVGHKESLDRGFVHACARVLDLKHQEIIVLEGLHLDANVSVHGELQGVGYEVQ